MIERGNVAGSPWPHNRIPVISLVRKEPLNRLRGLRSRRGIAYNAPRFSANVDQSVSEESEVQTEAGTGKDKSDSAADTRAIVVMFAALVLMALHYVSGFTFDF